MTEPMALDAKALEAARNAVIPGAWGRDIVEAAICAYLAALPPPAAGEGLRLVAGQSYLAKNGKTVTVQQKSVQAGLWASANYPGLTWSANGELIPGAKGLLADWDLVRLISAGEGLEPVAWRWHWASTDIWNEAEDEWTYTESAELAADLVPRTDKYVIEPLYAATPAARAAVLEPETGWLIELVSRSGPPTWWSLVDTGGDGGYFSGDPSKALRFARKQDAEACINDIGWTECIATEHEWSDSPPRALKEKT